MIPGLGRSPGEGNGNPLQYSCMGNPMDRGAWRAIVHGGRKELDTTKQLTTHTHIIYPSPCICVHTVCITQSKCDHNFMKFSSLIYMNTYIETCRYTCIYRERYISYISVFIMAICTESQSKMYFFTIHIVKIERKKDHSRSLPLGSK